MFSAIWTSYKEKEPSLKCQAVGNCITTTNALTYSANVVQQFLYHNHPFSKLIRLAPLNFFLFPKMKIELKS